MLKLYIELKDGQRLGYIQLRDGEPYYGYNQSEATELGLDEVKALLRKINLNTYNVFAKAVVTTSSGRKRELELMNNEIVTYLSNMNEELHHTNYYRISFAQNRNLEDRYYVCGNTLKKEDEILANSSISVFKGTLQDLKRLLFSYRASVRQQLKAPFPIIEEFISEDKLMNIYAMNSAFTEIDLKLTIPKNIEILKATSNKYFFEKDVIELGRNELKENKEMNKEMNESWQSSNFMLRDDNYDLEFKEHIGIADIQAWLEKRYDRVEMNILDNPTCEELDADEMETTYATYVASLDKLGKSTEGVIYKMFVQFGSLDESQSNKMNDYRIRMVEETDLESEEPIEEVDDEEIEDKEEDVELPATPEGALADYLGVELDEVVETSRDHYGITIYDADGEEWAITDDYDLVERAAKDEVISLIDELGVNSLNWDNMGGLINFVDTEWFDIAMEESNENYVYDMRDSEKIEYLKDMLALDEVTEKFGEDLAQSYYNSNCGDYEAFAEKLTELGFDLDSILGDYDEDEERDLEDEIYNSEEIIVEFLSNYVEDLYYDVEEMLNEIDFGSEWDEELVEYLNNNYSDGLEWYIDQFGEESMNELINDGTISIDTEGAAQQCLDLDGPGHLLSGYDGNMVEQDIKGTSFYMFRID